MNSLWQDLRYGVRMLAKSPGFTAVAVLTFALGIGANTAIFSVVNGVLLNPLPFEEPVRLVALYSHTKEFLHSSISYPNFLDWRRNNDSFSGMAAFLEDDFTLTGVGEPERVGVEMISWNFFQVLGVKPILGRTFLPQEDQLGATPVVLLSEGFWKRKFGSSPEAVARTITLNGSAYAIVGIIPSSFRYQSGNFHSHCDAYVPIGQWNNPLFRDRRVGMGMDAVGRLKPGVTLGQARADMGLVAQRLARAYPEVDTGSGITLVPLKEDFVGRIRPFLLMLLAAVGFVLLIACVNLANLLLARSASRAHEFAIRAALGATQRRFIRQLLTESMVLSAAGGLLGLVVAAWGTGAALSVLPEALPRVAQIGVDAHVLLFTLGVSILAGTLFGLAPAFKTVQPNPAETLKEGGRGQSGTRHLTQSVFVVVETALALVLLVGAGLMIRSLVKLWSVNPGFDPRQAAIFSASFPTPIGTTPDSIRAALQQLHDAVSAVPGVEAVSLTVGAVPMMGDSEIPFWLEGQPKPPTESQMKLAVFYGVEPDYLKVMKIPLERGRFLTPVDNEHSPVAVVIDDQFAGLYFPGQDPVGKRINFDFLDVTAEVVGVVGHVKQWGLDENSKSPVEAQFYFPVSQTPGKLLPLLAQGISFAVRTQGSSLAEMAAIRQALAKVNSQAAIYDAEAMDSVISDSLAARRFSMILLGAFAALALVLAAVGIYGVISYLSVQRTHEIGIRMALGAQPADILKMVLGQGMRTALAGVGIGFAAALGLTRLMAKMIFGVKPADPLTLISVALLLSVVALAACYIPARRAMHTDPMVALRYE